MKFSPLLRKEDWEGKTKIRRYLETVIAVCHVSFTHPWEIQPPRFMLLFDSHDATHPAWERSRPCSAALEKEWYAPPALESAPQSRLFAAICWIKLIVSEESFCILDRAFDLRFQNRRKSSRCHRRSVSGWTRKRASFQVRTIRARSTRSNRSVFRYIGRLICRRRISSWCRKSAFSAISSDFPLVRSASVPSTREVVGGLIQRGKRSWSA